MALGAVLVLAGLGGAISACTTDPEQINLVQAVVSGLAFGLGIVAIALGGARHGYHRRPLGAPPGDTDPAKTTDPAPDKL
ncbi:MAG: hypothetical protein R2712_07255 [Vicinamibacterales bacterium]